MRTCSILHSLFADAWGSNSATISSVRIVPGVESPLHELGRKIMPNL